MGKARNLDVPTKMGSLDGNQWRRQRILDIERRIRHSDMGLTGRYLAQMRSDENAYADELARKFTGK